MKKITKKAILWLNTESEFYTNMAEEPITRKEAILWNIAFVSFFVGVLIIAQQTILGLAAVSIAALLGRKLQKEDDK